MKQIRQMFILLALCFCNTLVAQDDEVVTLSATVTGNKEQPKVLYIVPWKQAQDTSILQRGLESRLGDVFTHVEPSEHNREINYLETLAESPQEQE